MISRPVQYAQHSAQQQRHARRSAETPEESLIDFVRTNELAHDAAEEDERGGEREVKETVEEGGRPVATESVDVAACGMLVEIDGGEAPCDDDAERDAAILPR